MLDQLVKACDSAQNELAQAEIALIEATASAEALREEVRRLSSAVAALRGENVPSEPHSAAKPVEDTQKQAEDTPKGDIHEMTPEQFDAERKRRQRAKEKEAMANNPMAHVRCGGCGVAGHMSDQIIQAPSGAPIRMMICGKCKNQVMA